MFLFEFAFEFVYFIYLNNIYIYIFYITSLCACLYPRNSPWSVSGCGGCQERKMDALLELPASIIVGLPLCQGFSQTLIHVGD